VNTSSTSAQTAFDIQKDPGFQLKDNQRSRCFKLMRYQRPAVLTFKNLIIAVCVSELHKYVFPFTMGYFFKRTERKKEKKNIKIYTFLKTQL